MIRAGTVSKILGAGFRLGWLCADPAMIPVFQSFLFGGGVNPFASRVATYYLRDHMAEHVALLVDVYRAKRDAMLKGLWDVLGRHRRGDQQARGRLLHLDQAARRAPTPRGSPSGRRARACSTRPARRSSSTAAGEQFIRLAYSFEPPERCHDGARILAEAILESRR